MQQPSYTLTRFYFQSTDLMKFLGVPQTQLKKAYIIYCETIIYDKSKVRTKSCTVTFGSSSIMRAKSNRFLLLLLASWFAVSVTTAQIRLNVFRGTLVHSRVRTELEVLPDHLIGIDVNDLGRVRLQLFRQHNS